MNFKPLFTTSRVVQEVYKIASTAFLFVYLFRRKRRPYDSDRRWHDY